MRLSIFACTLMLALPSGAQNVTGSISGSVQDSSGQVVPAAGVTISNSATGAAVKLTSDERGDFTANGLQAGTYSLLIAKSGFKQFEESGIEQIGRASCSERV